VSYQKGCFVGQEVASRMKRKSDARKRAAALQFEADAAPSGSPITAGDVTVGAVLSVSGANAIGLIRLDRLEKAREASAILTADGRALTISLPSYLDEA
ncbi:MAG: folate-binding protein, partial [Pseudomonadota bacterium]